MEASLVHYDSSISVHVTPYVNTGIHHLMLAYQILSNVYIESNKPFTKYQMQNIYDLILKAYKDFENANNNLSILRSNANQEFEKSISTEKVLSDIIRNLEAEIERTNLEINEKRYANDIAQIHLQTAHQDHKYAERNMDRAVNEYHRKRREGERGVYSIPFIGEIAAIFTGLSDEIERARRKQEFAWDDYMDRQNSLDRRKRELEELGSNIESLKNTLFFNEHERKVHTASVADLKNIQKLINENRVNLGDYLHISSTLLRKTKILMSESSEVLSVEPLLNVFHDVAKSLKGSSHKTKMLKSEKLKSFLLLADPVVLEKKKFGIA
ncbi:uncharacterized protein LOC127716123 [Mytilus californianus]|uniref:uncharacterized protein LOC127716123 n=1 Tax=Mytilus californianus TaxID=6549 RepID=UPI002246E221|nr:uncharacterized protein LOC127716123 [Mytilus californianus]XP_052078165.1 uncharacterized protein LOC127716123 [Mytilus californianus]